MNKNKKMLFLAVALVTVLILVSAVNATNTTDKSIDNTISEKTSTQASNIIKEKTTTKEKIETNKNNEIKKTNKTDKNLKTTTKNVEINSYDELSSAINGALIDNENDEYIIEFNKNGNYIITSDISLSGTSSNVKTIILEGNNITATGSGSRRSLTNQIEGVSLIINNMNVTHRLYNYKNLIINSTDVQSRLHNYAGETIFNNSMISGVVQINDGFVKFENSVINGMLINEGTLIIDDYTTFGDNFSIQNSGTLIMNDTSNFAFYESTWNGDYTFKNVVLNSQKENMGNVTFINSTLNSIIYNSGNMTISDDTDFGENFVYSGTGNLIINDISRIIPYMSSFNGFTLENVTFTKGVSFDGDNTLINCIFENIQAYRVIENNGNLTMINCTIRNCSMTQSDGALIANGGNLTINDMNMSDNFLNLTYSISLFRNIGSNPTSLTLNNFTFANNELICIQWGSGSVGFIGATTVYVNNSVFTNNSGFVKTDDSEEFDYKSNLISCTNGVISNSVFENNKAMAILGNNINLTNCTFKNNTGVSNSRTGFSAMVNIMSSGNVSDCKFIDNSLSINNSRAYNSEPNGALKITNGIVTNCLFENNSLECNSIWLNVNGAAISGRNLNITNNNFTNNHINTVKGTSASTESYEFDFSSSGYGVDIYADGTTTITGNNFINSTGNQDVGSIYSSNQNSVIEITNNNFSNCKANKETIAVISKTKNIADNTFTNCSIGFKTLNLTAPSKVYSNEDVSVSLNVELAYPDNYDADLLEKTDYTWYINGENTTTKDTTKTVSVGTSNVIVYVTPTVSNNRTRVLSLIPTVLTDVVITPENINNYVVMGELQVNPNTKVIFQGTFTDIGEINNNKNEVLFDGSNATFTNTCFTIEANDNTIQNMNINNKDTSNYIIQNTGNNTVIQNNILTQYNTNGQTAAIKDSNSKNTIITQNTITVTGPAKDVMSEGGVRIANTQAILSKNTTQSTITYNNITVNNSTNPELASFTTIEAITAPQTNKNQISYNNIQCTGARFNYGIDLLNNVDENEISYNNITATGYRYCDGIQIGDNATNNLIANNNIKITCLNTTPVDEAAISYGIIVTSQGGLKADNNTITQNNIEINGIVNYGIEIYTASNTPITDNNITLTGAKSMGIGYAHSPNSTVTDNTINTNDDSSIPINGITEEIQPLNTGILTQQDSDNILIENNTIQTYDKQGQDTCIKIESSNVTIKNNNLTSSTKTGDNTITTTQPDTTTIENNNAIQQNSTTQTTTEDLTVGDSTTITAQFYDDTYTPVADGKAIFRVNGKTLRDDQGNVIYADVINGRVELPDVNITQEWTKDDTTIQAIYVGNDNNAPITTTPTTVTVTKPEATITLDAPTTATAGQEITLKATVTDGDTAITSGRVAFKLNGKTLKNAEGKALYAEVKDGIATITYTIPEKTKAKEYVLTAVFTDAKYDRKEAESKLKVVKA